MTDVGIGMTLSLGFLASKGNYKLLEEFLRRGRDPNTTDYCGRTPLVWSIFFNYAIVEEIILLFHYVNLYSYFKFYFAVL